MTVLTKLRALPILGLATLAAAGCQSIPPGPGVNSEGTSANQAVDEAVAVQELRQELAELQNKVEIQGNELSKLRERQRQMYDDLDYRLSEPGSGTVPTQRREQATGQTDGGGGSVGAPVQDSVSSDQRADQEVYGQQGVSGEPDTNQQSQGTAAGDGADEPVSQQSAAVDSAGSSDREPRASQGSVASSEEQAAYDGAFDLLKQSRYNDAIIEFRSVISQFPNGALADDAQYWIGEAYYVNRDFDSALDAFSSVVNRYPDSQRLPEAMLKQGYVQAELGRQAEARQTLNRVISEYPGSRVAISAETRLSRIR